MFNSSEERGSDQPFRHDCNPVPLTKSLSEPSWIKHVNLYTFPAIIDDAVESPIIAADVSTAHDPFYLKFFPSEAQGQLPTLPMPLTACPDPTSQSYLPFPSDFERPFSALSHQLCVLIYPNLSTFRRRQVRICGITSTGHSNSKWRGCLQ